MRFEKWQAAGNAYLVMEAGTEVGHPLTPARVQRICHPDSAPGATASSDPRPVAPGHTPACRSEPRRRRGRVLRQRQPHCGGATWPAATASPGSRSRRSRVVADGVVDGTSVTIDAGVAALEGSDHAPGAGAPPGARLHLRERSGNPHCVIETEEVDGLDLAAVGAPIEHHPWFPNRTNVEFYRPLGGNDIRMRVWERGAGETLSSGCGSSAAAVAAVVAGTCAQPCDGAHRRRRAR